MFFQQQITIKEVIVTISAQPYGSIDLAIVLGYHVYLIQCLLDKSVSSFLIVFLNLGGVDRLHVLICFWFYNEIKFLIGDVFNTDSIEKCSIVLLLLFLITVNADAFAF